MPTQSTPTVSDSLPFAVADRRKRGYFTVDNVLLDIYGAQLGPYGIAVYCCLARFANHDQECWPTLRTIAERTGVSRSQVIRELDKLEALTIISVTPRFNAAGDRTSHLYTLLDIVGGGFPVEPPRESTGKRPDARAKPEQSPKKKDTHPKLDRKSAYIPAEWADIIRG